MRKFVIFAAVLVAFLLLLYFFGGGSPQYEQPASASTTPSGSAQNPLSPSYNLNVTPAPLSVEFVYTELVRYSDGKEIYYLAEIKNTCDKTVVLDDLAIDVETAEGQLVKVVKYFHTYPKEIVPGGSAYIYQNVLDSVFEDTLDLSANYQCNIRYELEKSTLPEIPVEVTQTTLGSYVGFPKLLGKVKNFGHIECNDVIVSAPLFSADGQLLGLFHTYVDIPAGEEIGFEDAMIDADYALDYSDAILGEITVTASSLTY